MVKITSSKRGAGKTRATWAVAATLLAAVAVSTPASAIVVVDTYAGLILTNAQIALYYPGNTDNDLTGLFGSASQTGADIAGQAFKAVVTTDLALAPSVYIDPTTGDVSSAYASGQNAAAFSSVTVTINGVSVSWSENYGSAIAPSIIAEGGEFQEARLYREGLTCCSADTFSTQVVTDPRGGDFPDSLTMPGSYSVQASGDVTDLFTIQVTNPGPEVYTRGFLAPTSLTVAVLAAPEPSVWTMMIAGVFGIGAALRGRRRQPLLA